MVVGYIQPQSVKTMPKKPEIQPASGKNSFESLMNDRINKENLQKPLDAKDKAQKDDINKLDKMLEKDDKKDVLDQTMAALSEKAATQGVENSPEVLLVLTAEQANAQQLAIQLAQSTQPVQQAASIQADGGITAAEHLIAPQENPKLQDGNGKANVSSSLENGDDLNSELQMKIPFEKILESGQDVKIPVVNTQTKTEGATTESKGNNLTDVSTAVTQAQGSSQEKGATAEQINVMPQQMTSQTLDPNNINIKVGEAVDTKSEVFAQDFADKVVYKINQDVKEFQIELNPMDMGKVSIKVVFAAEKAFVSLSCENAKTQSLLAQSSDTIRSIIQQNVGSETVVVVQEQQPQQNYQQQQERQEQQEQDRQNKPQQKISEDSLTFVNQLRLGLVDINSKL